MSKPNKKPGTALAVVDKPSAAVDVVDGQIDRRKAQREARENLTTAEETKLEELESVIAENLRSGLKAFVTIGTALLPIHEKKLYRADYRTFEEYCLKRWDITRQHAYRLMGAAKVQKVLKPVGYTLPNEAAAREFAPIADKPMLIKKVAQALGENPTASAVRTEVAKHAKIEGGTRTKAAKPTDKITLAHALPQKLVDEFHEWVKNLYWVIQELDDRDFDTAPLHKYVTTILQQGHKVDSHAWTECEAAMQKQLDIKEKEVKQNTHGKDA